jgi:hypothetical protein
MTYKAGAAASPRKVPKIIQPAFAPVDGSITVVAFGYRVSFSVVFRLARYQGA